MHHWENRDSTHVWAWSDKNGAEYRAIWSPQKGSIELIRSVSAGAGWPTVAIVYNVNDLNLASHIRGSWYDLVFNIDNVK